MEQALSGSSGTDKFTEARRERRRKRRKQHRVKGLAAPIVFTLLVVLNLGAIAVVYLLKELGMPAGAFAVVLTAYALYVNDHKGFIRRKQMRRAFEARHNFNNLEVVILMGLIVLDFVVAGYVLLT